MYRQILQSLRAACGCAVAAMTAFVALPAQADDIDIFTISTSVAAGSTTVPNIMILVDNSSNWSRSSQNWPDNSGKQGQAELQAIRNVLAGSISANIGFAGFTGSGSSVGGYIRFGLRDMSVAANKTALLNIIDHIKADTNSSAEKVNDNAEAAGMYEVYKYYNSQTIFRGGYVSGNDPASNVDKSANAGNPSNGSNRPTAYAQGLTGGFAISTTDPTRYASPTAAMCGRNHLVLVINNAQGNIPEGAQTFETTSAGTALPALSGVSRTSWTDEWARFLYQSGITVYILDAYYAQQNLEHSRVLERAARVGGGKYYPVKNQSQIELAFKDILAEINAVNATFATASLPISATNRSENLNQVFIGMFRPDRDARPRWMGNLKQYKVLRSDSGVDLGDSLNVAAINSQTGFINDCSVSFWTADSSNYWENVYGNALAKSGCLSFPTVGGVTGSMWSDLPDGPSVEKGGVAEVIRRGNNPPATQTTPTWSSTSRTIYTFSAAATGQLATITNTNTPWSGTMLDWVKGYDDATAVVTDSVTTYPYSEFTTTSVTARTRPSIHGDLIHSRPLPVNYGGTTGVTVYYGTNDGLFRAIDATTGRERWAYVGPEHTSKVQRLRDNSPPLPYSTVASGLTPQAKDYFFDGSVGLYQNSDNSRVWIYPSQRRGGRMLYGFNVTSPAAPALKWRVGCPNLTNDTSCTSGFENMGQTWSLPNVAFIKGFSETTPVIITGGGYDTCEDDNSSAPSCVNATRKGKGVYVINADTGALIRHLIPTDPLTFTGSVIADIALADRNADGFVDYAYAVTTSGEIWRMDFSTFSGSTATSLASAAWKVGKVAYTTGAGRKFQWVPALLRSGTKMYVALGSGDREHPLSTQYPYTGPVANRFYVLLDDLSVASDAATAVNLDSTAGGMSNYSSSTACSATNVTASSGLKGWFMNLEGGTGEQTVTSALIAGGMVTFSTNRATPTGVNQCSNPLGEARGYWVNLLNASGGIGTEGGATCGGTRSAAFVGGGLVPSPTYATVVTDSGTRETVVMGAIKTTGETGSGISVQRAPGSLTSKRKSIYWKSNSAD